MGTKYYYKITDSDAMMILSEAMEKRDAFVGAIRGFVKDSFGKKAMFRQSDWDLSISFAGVYMTRKEWGAVRGDWRQPSKDHVSTLKVKPENKELKSLWDKAQSLAKGGCGLKEFWEYIGFEPSYFMFQPFAIHYNVGVDFILMTTGGKWDSITGVKVEAEELTASDYDALREYLDEAKKSA